MKNKTGQVLLHITGCTAFLSLPVLLSPDVSWNFHFLQLPPFRQDLLSYGLILLFFYLNYFWLIPRLYFREKYFLYFSAVLGCYAVVALLPGLLVPGSQHAGALPPPGGFSGMGMPGMHPPPYSRLPRFEHLFQFSMVFILSALIRINNRMKQTEKDKVNAELSYLKAQINPHFLFNTLNSIYSAALQENADTTAGAVVKLSGMMRYVISEAHNDFVSLQKEIDYISDYIALQKIRLGNTVAVNYLVNGSTAGKQIAPLLLISFIENAFKHGVNPEEPSIINIEMEMQDQFLKMRVANARVTTRGASSDNHHIGLRNTRNRLQLLYPSRHELVIKEDEKEFIVLLTLNLQA